MKILCGTDLLPTSDPAIERAGLLAERLAAQLILIHAVPCAEPQSVLEEELRRAGLQLRHRATPPHWRRRVVPSFQIRAGNPAQVLVEAARALQPALIVLGSNRHRFACHALAGTIAERVLKEVDVPVLVVRRMASRAYRRVLLVLGCSGSSDVLAAAGQLVLHGSAKTMLTQDPEFFRASLATPGKRATGHVERPLVDPKPTGRTAASPGGQRSHLEVIHERALSAAVMQQVSRLTPDLLVVSAGNRAWVRRTMLADTVSRALAMRGFDVLIVPRRRECIAPGRKRGSRGRKRCPALLRRFRIDEQSRRCLGKSVVEAPWWPAMHRKQVCK